MTGGSHDHPDKYLGDASRTVRRHLADCPRGGCYREVLETTVAKQSRSEEAMGTSVLQRPEGYHVHPPSFF